MEKQIKHVLFVLIAFTLSVSAQKNKTSKNYTLLKSVFEKNLLADTDKNGILTEEEYRAYQFVGLRKKRFKEFAGYYEVIKDVPYVKNGAQLQKLDIIIPENRTKASLPVIVFIHGGGWQKGDKIDGYPLMDDFLKDGNYIGVSINYRLTKEAKWPTQIHDCKAAVRWVKANADKYGIYKNKVAVWGTSAGGHLAAMMTITSGMKEWEGTYGDNLDENADVTCGINGFGPSDLLTEGTLMNDIAFNNFKDGRYNAFNLIGVDEIKAKAQNASPIHWVHKNIPPFMIYHGENDKGVSIEQSEKMYKKVKEAEVENFHYIRIKNMNHGHEGPKFAEIAKTMGDFFDAYLADETIDIPEKSTMRQPDKNKTN